MMAQSSLARAQHLEQLGGEVFLQHQRHLRHARDRSAHQVGQQVGADGVDHAEPQRAGQRVLAVLGDFLDAGRLVEHALRLAHDLLAQRRHRDFAAAALEKLARSSSSSSFLMATDKRRLRDVAGFGRLAEMFFAGDGDDVFEFSKSHSLRQLCAR